MPVTVDVIRLCGCRTGSLIICSLAADTVDGVAITCISIETTLQVNIVCTEHHVEVVAVRWFQTRVTLCNVQWVRVIGDVEQVGH